jgi:hypothetical protein
MATRHIHFLRDRAPRAAGWLVLAAAVAVAVASARTAPESWSDSSRLATVESLVDHHTLAIDRSLFGRATGDKICVDGRFYSHKPPVPALLLAGLYQCLQWTTGLTALHRPRSFCYWLTLGSSGLAYVVAVWCVFRLGRPLRLGLPLRLSLTAGFALATLALPYARQVNDHILLLGVAAALMLNLAWMAGDGGQGSFWRALGAGALAGLGYTIDLGAGPLLFACTLALIAYRGRRRLGVTLSAFLLGALPWLTLHHAVNYAIAGTWLPAAAIPRFFRWTGCSFTPRNLTGGWKHDGLLPFLNYAARLLASKRGFLVHNLPLLLAVPALVVLLWRRVREWPELAWGGAWAAGTWLLYAANSNNYAGSCCSIRWFVPLLAPGFYTLAVFLRDRPRFWGDFCVLGGWGLLLAGYAWRRGPWIISGVPFLWPVLIAALACWVVFRLWDWRPRQPVRAAEEVAGLHAPEKAA